MLLRTHISLEMLFSALTLLVHQLFFVTNADKHTKIVFPP